MAQITRLEVQKRNKNKVNLFLDGEFRCGLTAESVVRARLSVGMDLSESELEDILQTSETEIAFGKACDYLGRAMKTVKEMREYLSKKGFEQTVIDNVITKLKEYRYIDDEYYSQLYVNYNIGNKGSRRIASELTQKGIKKEIIEQRVSELDEQTMLDNAGLLADKYMRSKECTMENLIKLQRYLLSRGYDFDVIMAIIRRYKDEL